MMLATVAIAVLAQFAIGSAASQGQTPSLVPSATSPASPCSTAEHRQFDFWLGDWNV
jgi:hypothetical protein